jgi:hypothetical protein
MTLLRNTAVEKLKSIYPRLDPVKQIAIARKYQCGELVEEPFQTLVAREGALSKAEIANLPLDDLHRLILVREAGLREKALPTSGQCRSCTQTLQFSIGLCNSCRQCNSCGCGPHGQYRKQPYGTGTVPNPLLQAFGRS